MTRKLASLPLAAALLLSGCGFHLRGAMDLPQTMRAVYLTGPGAAALRTAFEDILNRAGGHLSDTRVAGGVVLNILNVDEDQRVISLTRGGRANEYDVTLKIAYEIKTAKDETVESKKMLNFSRDYYNDQFLVVGKNEEEARLRAELKNEAADMLVRHMAHLLKQRESLDH